MCPLYDMNFFSSSQQPNEVIYTHPSVPQGIGSRTPHRSQNPHESALNPFLFPLSQTLLFQPPAWQAFSLILSPYSSHFISEAFFGNLNCQTLTLKYFISPFPTFFSSQHLSLNMLFFFFF